METIRPKFSIWNFAARERKLFDEAAQLPTWRLANQSRRMLADVVSQLMDRTPKLAGKKTVDELPPRIARQRAAVQLSALTVRNAGSVIVLIGCGYEREALVPARVLVECSIRIQQLNDDTSGAVARQVLRGQQPRALKTVARRYGMEREVELLDRFAHCRRANAPVDL